MPGKTVIRTDLVEAVRQRVSLSRPEAAELVSQVLGEICDTLAAGEAVKLSGFGIFHVRDKAERVGRNPKTGVEVPIEPRQVHHVSGLTCSQGPCEPGFLSVTG